MSANAPTHGMPPLTPASLYRLMREHGRDHDEAADHVCLAYRRQRHHLAPLLDRVRDELERG